MSHTTKINSVAIRDERAIEQAVEKLQAKGVNISLKRNAEPRMFYSSQKEHCEYVLSLPNSRFDVGLQKNKDGNFVPVYDEYANHVGNVIGAVCNIKVNQDERALIQLGQFLQAYTECATVNAAQAAGYFVEGSQFDEKTGEVTLTLAQY